MSAYDSQTATTLINKLRKDVDSLTLKVAILTDSKPAGTSGGAGIATAWTTRDLNTIAVDPQGLILDLSNNQFKLASGSYQIRAIAAFLHTGHSRMRLYDVTNNVVIGYNVSIDVSNQSNVYPELNLTVNPHKDNVYRLEYYISANGADHLGIATSIDSIPETYCICEITRLDTGQTKPLGAGGLQGPQGPPGPTGPAGPPGPTGGGVTSVNISGGSTGLTTSGGPITSSGTITLGGVLGVANGGTGATTAAAALTSLGAYPASNPSGYTSNTGTVTSVSVTTANGVSGTVTNPTTTPAINLALGAITPTSVAASGSVTGSNLSGSNTGDQTITLTGDVTGSGTGSFAATIGSNKVTYAKMQAASAVSKLIGSNASSTALTEITLGTNLSMSGSTLNAAVASGTVTSVNADGGTTGFSFTGGPVTSSGTLSMTGTLAVGAGGTNATTASGARTNLGLAIGIDIPSTTGTGATGNWGINVTGTSANVTGTVAIANGGTGATTAAGALTNLGAYPNSNPSGYTSNTGTVTNVSAAGGANISVATGSTTPVISQVAASSTQNGYMTSTYAAKLDGITAGASVSSVGVSGGTTGLTTTGGPVTTAGTITLSGTLAIANGGTGLTSVGTQYQVLTSTGSAATWGSVDLNSGTSNVLPISKGGTSSITAQSAINALAGATTSGQYLRGNGTNVVMSAIQGADLPAISLNTGITGTLAVANGGTGQSNVYTDGDLLIGKSLGGTLNRAKLTAGTGISITNGSGSITIAATGSGSGDVTGPINSTNNTFALFDGTTGKVIKESSWIQKGGDISGPVGYSSMIDGFVYIPAGSTAPSGTPTNVTAPPTNVPMFLQTNNAANTNILWVHNGYAWKSVSLI